MAKLNLRQAILDAQPGSDIDKKQGEFLDAISSVLEKAMEDEGKVTGENIRSSIAEVIGELPKDKDGKTENIVSQLRSIAEQVDKINQRSTKVFTEKERFELRKQLESKDFATALREKKVVEINFRAAGTTTSSNMVNAGSIAYPNVQNFEVDNEIAHIRFPENFILTIIPNSMTPDGKLPLQKVIKTEQTTTEGAVAVVAEGGEKPLTQYKYVLTSTGRKKYAGRLNFTEEAQYDNEAIYNDIINLFEQDVMRTWQDGILDDIITNAVSYTSSALDGQMVEPDNIAAIAATASIINGLNFTADTVVMNPQDFLVAMFAQGNDGHYKNIPLMDGNNISGLRTIQSNKVDVGNALVGMASVYREKHSDYIVRTGYADGDFTKNQFTVIGEVYSILSIAQLNLPAWRYIDLDAVKTTLLKPIVP